MSFHSINLISQALRSFQRGMDVAGHNVANVNTPGYSRQRVSFSAVPGATRYGLVPYDIGNGVSISGVNRIRDLLLDARMNTATSDMGKFSSLAAALKQVEAAFPEPGPNGIGAALDKFFDAWSGLASNPNEPGLKVDVHLAAKTLTGRVRGAYAELERQQGLNQSGLNAAFDDIDGLTRRIAELNREIVARRATGTEPSDLLDLRDRAVEELSQYMDLQSHPQPDGSVTIYSNQLRLVDSLGHTPVPREYDAASQTLQGDGLTVNLRSGKLVGLMQAQTKVAGMMGQLDLLANNLRTEVNAIHGTGTVGGLTEVPFFNDGVPQTGARDFNLGADILNDPSKIATGVSGNAGDGGVALALSQLREKGITALGGKTFRVFYSETVSGIGREAAFVQALVGTQSAIVEQISNQRQSISGVNLDDEMMEMMRYQRSYQAAARALSVADQMTEDLIRMIR
jgi:flagellar hook-associated protein 1